LPLYSDEITSPGVNRAWGPGVPQTKRKQSLGTGRSPDQEETELADREIGSPEDTELADREIGSPE